MQDNSKRFASYNRIGCASQPKTSFKKIASKARTDSGVPALYQLVSAGQRWSALVRKGNQFFGKILKVYAIFILVTFSDWSILISTHFGMIGATVGFCRPDLFDPLFMVSYNSRAPEVVYQKVWLFAARCKQQLLSQGTQRLQTIVQTSNRINYPRLSPIGIFYTSKNVN